MPLKLYLDEDIQAELAPALRLRHYDVISTRDAGRQEATDRDQLEFAVSERRAILTYNVKDYVPLYIDYLQRSQTHYGIIVSPQLSFSAAFHRIMNLLSNLTAEDMMNRLEYLSNWR